MKLRMDKTLGFWVDVAREHIKSSRFTREQLTTHILREYERFGHAMRSLDERGRICWKPTPSFLERLADAEREVEEDCADLV
jgi:hypothetical protein